jgi:predicted HTH transcriptional regulator
MIPPASAGARGRAEPDAIDKANDTKKIEMARDVSAFANADGGQLVYGMTERDHEPAGLDQGIEAKLYPEIWFEQVLQQHITPSISPAVDTCHYDRQLSD